MNAPGGTLGLGVGLGAVALAVLAGGAWWLYANRDKLNPASQNNVANQLSNAGVQALTGGAAAGGEDSLGGVAARFVEWLSGTDAKIEAMKRGAPPQQLGATAVGPYGAQLDTALFLSP